MGPVPGASSGTKNAIRSPFSRLRARRRLQTRDEKRVDPVAVRKPLRSLRLPSGTCAGLLRCGVRRGAAGVSGVRHAGARKKAARAVAAVARVRR
eukprot:1438217-Prymnesium_polylepis.2